MYKYITKIVQNNGHKMLAINGMPDHLHIVAGMRPTESIADLMKEVKGDSSAWINKKRLTSSKFQWQEGYGAFSYSLSHLHNVIAYVENQQMHHKTKTFQEEYKEILNSFRIPFEERFLFQPVV